MIVGSSLGRQLAPYIQGNHIFFRGNISLGFVEESLLEVGYVERIIIASGNDLYPSQICKGHKCLNMCDLDRVTATFDMLLDILFMHTFQVRVIEPPPRCKKIAGHPNCTFWEDIEEKARFRTMINRLKDIRAGNNEILGVVSNDYLRKAMRSESTWSLTGSDLTHFSRPAVLKLSQLLG